MVFLFYSFAASSFPCLSYYTGSCDSCYPLSFNQAKFVQGGLRQKSQYPTQLLLPRRGEFLFMLLHLLPSLLVTSEACRRRFPKSPKPTRLILTEPSPKLTSQLRLLLGFTTFTEAACPLRSPSAPGSVIESPAMVSWSSSVSSPQLSCTAQWNTGLSVSEK